MSRQVKKSEDIIRRLNEAKNNLSVLNELVTEALSKLEDVTKKITDDTQFVSMNVVRENWITKKDAEELLESRTLLEECKREIDAIDEATKGVEGALNPLMGKVMRK